MRQVRVRPARRRQLPAHDRVVLEDIVALLVGIALLVYLLYALARPERF